QNGSSKPGLGQEMAAYLQGLGVNVVEVNDSSQRSTLSSVKDNSGKPYTLGYLVDLIGVNPARISIGSDPATQVDVELILGDDWSASQLP
ncbi:MAG: LytR C-terminal domain-containing protein, partial [Anaerolineales bacterium]